ncbi:hypothetical protein CR513_55818, partial [Mucuna pruriens]
MSTLVRNTTLSFSRRYRYEILGLQGKDKMLKSISYRRRRAKQRQIFLTTYKLSSINNNNNNNTFVEPQRHKLKLKKVAVKVKKIMASVLMFMRVGSFRSCTSRSAISATSSPFMIYDESLEMDNLQPSRDASKSDCLQDRALNESTNFDIVLKITLRKSQRL